MKGDFEILKYKFENEIRVVPIGDMHIGSIEFNLDRWKKFKQYILENEDIYIFLLGDLIDNQTINSHSPFSISVIDGIAMTPSEQKSF